MQDSASVPNSATGPNLDNANGHKAVKIKKLRSPFKLNSIKAKLKQTTTVGLVANYWPATHMRIRVTKSARYKNPHLVAQHEQIYCMTSCKFDEKRATKPKFVAQSTPVLYFSQQLPSTAKKINEHFCCATS